VEPGLRFADLLRQLRTEARLTQEELAEQAGLSPRSVSDLERGINRTARKDSALMLASALKLTGPVQEAFVAAARGRAEPARVLAVRSEAAPESSAAAATRTLPRDIGGFTGRERELTGLEKSLAKRAGGGLVGIYAIDGMAGIGKTTFAVHAAHRLAGRFPDGQFFLPLHAHTAGQSPVDPADALASLLMTAGVAAQHIPPGLEARAAKWRDHVAGKKILLLLDDVAGHEQVRPLLPGSAASLVLVTSRRRLTALEDAIVISIDTLSPDEAWALLVRLADRADLELDEAAGREITRLCGFLPLAVGMLARRLRHHPARTAAELAAELAVARDRLAVMRAETCRSRRRSICPIRTSRRISKGCSDGSASRWDQTSTRTRPPRWTTRASRMPGASWTSSTIIICSLSRRRAGTCCTTCCASTHARSSRRTSRYRRAQPSNG
jgi:transcriptional regulator with XRE-family HTH domain